MVGMFVSLCLASKKSFEREFSVPAGTHRCKAVNDIFHCVINSTQIIAKPNEPKELAVSHLHYFIGWRKYV